MKRWGYRLWLPLWLVLAGCAAPAAVPQKHYSLTAAVATAKMPAAQRQPKLVLRVERVAAAPWLRDQRMCYRLRYRSRAAVAYYRDSHWTAPASAMLGQLVQDTLAGSGIWRAVIGPDDGAQANLNVRIRLLDLCQDFSSPRRSAAVFDALVTVVRNDTGAVIAQHEFKYRQRTPTPDAAGGARAERVATRAFAAALTQWLAGLEIRLSEAFSLTRIPAVRRDAAFSFIAGSSRRAMVPPFMRALPAGRDARRPAATG